MAQHAQHSRRDGSGDDAEAAGASPARARRRCTRGRGGARASSVVGAISSSSAAPKESVKASTSRGVLVGDGGPRVHFEMGHDRFCCEHRCEIPASALAHPHLSHPAQSSTSHRYKSIAEIVAVGRLSSLHRPSNQKTRETGPTLASAYLADQCRTCQSRRAPVKGRGQMLEKGSSPPTLHGHQ